MSSFLIRIRKWIRRVALRPIRVFVFHHVSDERDPLVSGKSDWTPTSVFRANLLTLKNKYRFISLETAYTKICHDHLRFRRYAVLTTDDGLQTVCRVWPWLEEQQIPLTCFVNAKYMDGHSYKQEDSVRILREDPAANVEEVIKRQYMSREQVFQLRSPLISIGSHGYEHLNATTLDEQKFLDNVLKCKEILETHPRYVRFFAYTWGRHNKKTDRILNEMGLIPVLVDGDLNYGDPRFVHRECIDGLVSKDIL